MWVHRQDAAGIVSRTDGQFVFSPNENQAPLWRDVLQWENYYEL